MATGGEAARERGRTRVRDRREGSATAGHAPAVADGKIAGGGRGTAKARPEELLSTLEPLVPLLGELFGPECEVVLHDLRRPESSIVAIANGHVTGRRAGGPVVGGPVEDQAFAWLHRAGPPVEMRVYPTETRDGRRLKSATILYRDAEGTPLAALCINYDVEPALSALRFLRSLAEVAPPSGEAPRGEGAAPVDVEEALGAMIRSCLEEVGVAPAAMTRQDRFEVVRCLDAQGAFLIRGAAQRVAKALKVSKFTVYHYLDEVRHG
ncbi:MAG: PAS domain-containing protein [Clostridia bacterium]|nr:PAS domain-containing protein [Clostridia bacterium]